VRLIDRVLTEMWDTLFTTKEHRELHHLFPQKHTPPLGIIIADEVYELMCNMTGTMNPFHLEGAHLPYPTTWIEARETPSPKAVTQGMMLTQYRGEFDGVHREGFQAVVMMGGPNKPVVLPGHVYQLEMQNGKLQELSIRRGTQRPDVPDIGRAMEEVVFILFALGMANARNVTLEQVDPPPKLSRKFKRRRGRPLIRHKRIILPAKTRAAVDLAQARKAAGDPQPLHLRRGHTKTYTAERPLLGKHVGEYWWDWAVLGDPAAGINVNTYEIQPPDE
jgi:hypothetical protein